MIARKNYLSKSFTSLQLLIGLMPDCILASQSVGLAFKVATCYLKNVIYHPLYFYYGLITRINQSNKTG